MAVVPAVDLALPLSEDGAVEALVAHVAGEAGLVPGAPGAAHQLRDEHLQRRGEVRWAGVLHAVLSSVFMRIIQNN